MASVSQNWMIKCFVSKKIPAKGLYTALKGKYKNKQVKRIF